MESNVHRMYLIWFYPTCYLVVFSISKKLSKLYSSVLLDTIGSEPKRKFLTWGKWEYWWLVAGWLWRESRNISITRQSYTFSLSSLLSPSWHELEYSFLVTSGLFLPVSRELGVRLHWLLWLLVFISVNGPRLRVWSLNTEIKTISRII